MAFDVDLYIQTQGLSGGPIITDKIELPIPAVELPVDENGNSTTSGLIGYFVSYAIAAGAFAYWYFA